ncbi:MAG: hypothetical protein HOP19_29435 [Acidobacteria bacterium]|nr:hypothetical protein [Acidobacteriota bacterium]
MSATVTITLPTDLAQSATAKAQAMGQQMEGYILHLLQKDAELPTLRDLFADVRADIQARGISDEELAQDIDAAVAEVRARRRG